MVQSRLDLSLTTLNSIKPTKDSLFWLPHQTSNPLISLKKSFISLIWISGYHWISEYLDMNIWMLYWLTVTKNFEVWFWAFFVYNMWKYDEAPLLRLTNASLSQPIVAYHVRARTSTCYVTYPTTNKTMSTVICLSLSTVLILCLFSAVSLLIPSLIPYFSWL